MEAALKLTTPPAACAPLAAHRAYAMRALDVIEDEVTRLETPGLNLTLTWTIGRDLGGMSVGAFYCFGCAELHRELATQERHDGPLKVEKL